MATSAESNQVRGVVVALLTAQLFVMNMQVSLGSTDLASPAIASQYLFSQLIVELSI
jgi:hypothetical protein